MMSRLPRLEKTILLITTSLALGCALIVYISIAYSPFPSPYIDLKIETSDNIVRQPASNDKTLISDQSQLSGQSNSESISMSTLDLNCLIENNSWELNSAPRMLQIKGQLCGEGELSKIEIINRSNGARAIIFELKGKKFLSDYISLSPGLNQLILEAESSSGRRFVNNFRVQPNDLSH